MSGAGGPRVESQVSPRRERGPGREKRRRERGQWNSDSEGNLEGFPWKGKRTVDH